jgi:hypothetical protein
MNEWIGYGPIRGQYLEGKCQSRNLTPFSSDPSAVRPEAGACQEMKRVDLTLRAARRAHRLGVHPLILYVAGDG